MPRPSDPQSLNRYSYVRNNPLKYTDPSGHFENEAILEHLQQAHPETWESIWATWLDDVAWMDMLHTAVDGDIASYMDSDGSLGWFKFTGYLNEKLTGAELVAWPTDSESLLGISLQNIQSGILGSRVSGLLRPSSAGITVRETLPYDLGGHYMALLDYHQVDNHGEAFVNHVLREGALTGGGAVIGTAFGGFPFGTVGGAGIGWAFEVAADYCLSDYGASVGDERIRLRYSLTTSNPGYARAAARGGSSTVRSYWMRPTAYGVQ